MTSMDHRIGCSLRLAPPRPRALTLALYRAVLAAPLSGRDGEIANWARQKGRKVCFRRVAAKAIKLASRLIRDVGHEPVLICGLTKGRR